MCELCAFRALILFIFYITFSEIVAVSTRHIKKRRVVSPEPGSPAYGDLPALMITYVSSNIIYSGFHMLVPDIG